MKNKKLTVLTEGGTRFGLGHITRCLAISKYFSNYNIEIEFIVHGDESVSFLLTENTYKLRDWLEDDTLLDELLDSSIVLIDSLLISDIQILKIQNTGIPIIYIDDEKRRNILEKGFVLDWTVLSSEKNYFLPKKEDVSYLLGSIYTPLRDEFQNLQRNKIKKNLNSIMVTFGGADVRDLTPIVLKTLIEEFPQIKKNIIIGAGFTNIDKIERIKDNFTNLIYNADAKTMVTLMQKNDIAIASGGQTLYELAYMGLPTIAILLVENARDDTEGWATVGSLEYIGNYDNKDLMSNLIKAIQGFNSQKKRQLMQYNSQNYIGSNGGKLIVEKVMETIL